MMEVIFFSFLNMLNAYCFSIFPKADKVLTPSSSKGLMGGGVLIPTAAQLLIHAPVCLGISGFAISTGT